MKNSKFIFNSFKQDILKIFVIFSIAILLAYLPEDYLKYIALSILILFDYNHIFYSYKRLLNQNDWDFVKKKLLTYSVGCSLLIISLLFLENGLNYLISLSIYYNFYHIIKQHEGIIKWYLKKDPNEENIILPKIITYSVYFFIFSIHFRENFYVNLFSDLKNKSDFIFYNPSNEIYQYFFIISLTIMICNILYISYNLYRKKYIYSNIYALFVISIYFFSGFIATNVFQLYLVHAIIHSYHYLNIMNKSVKDIEKNVNYLKIISFFIIISILFFIFEKRLSEYVNNYVFYLIYLIPQWVHYYLDRLLWNKKNTNWKNIISK